MDLETMGLIEDGRIKWVNIDRKKKKKMKEWKVLNRRAL